MRTRSSNRSFYRYCAAKVSANAVGICVILIYRGIHAVARHTDRATYLLDSDKGDVAIFPRTASGGSQGAPVRFFLTLTATSISSHAQRASLPFHCEVRQSNERPPHE
ncbi:hypothetical protein KC325_g8 [Hortaea werneckii]|nr:hypothetical protein KC325_g8 [Hortaea werneckii]